MSHSWELVSMISCPYKQLCLCSSMANYKVKEKNLHLYNFFSFFFFISFHSFSLQKGLCNVLPQSLMIKQLLMENKTGKVSAFMGLVIYVGQDRH